MNIKIGLVDDHRVLREGMRALLAGQKDFEVVGEAGDGLEALRLVEQRKPDVLLTDLLMPSLEGLEVTRQVSKRFSRTRVVILSMHRDESYVLEALKNGAIGYVLKDATAEEVIRAVREAMAGRRYLSPPLSERAMDAYLQRTRSTQSADRYDTLTAREREILQLTAEGHTNIEIGHRLYISPRTVETHRANFMHKLGLRSHTEVIRFAIQRGIIKVEPVKKPA